MSTPFIIEWPEDLESFPFASSTSLISEEILKKQVDQRTDDLGKFYEYLQSLGGNEKIQKAKYALNMNEDSNKSQEK